MTLKEMRDILATIAAYDGRAVDRRVIEDWHEAVGGIPYDLARAAVVAWYQEESGYMKPRDLIEYAMRLAGRDKPASVTDMRLAGVSLPYDGLHLVAPLALDGSEEEGGSDEA